MRAIFNTNFDRKNRETVLDKNRSIRTKEAGTGARYNHELFNSNRFESTVWGRSVLVFRRMEK